MGQLEEIALIEQIHLDRAGIDELADGAALQRRDPVHAVTLLQGLDLFLGDHPAIAHHNDRLQGKALFEFVHLSMSVSGSAVLPGKTEIATGRPRASVSRPSLTCE